MGVSRARLLAAASLSAWKKFSKHACFSTLPLTPRAQLPDHVLGSEYIKENAFGSKCCGILVLRCCLRRRVLGSSAVKTPFCRTVKARVVTGQKEVAWGLGFRMGGI